MLPPVFMVRDIAEAIAFYTRILDFELESPVEDEAPYYVSLLRGQDELHLNLAQKPDAGKGSAIVICDDVDRLFDSFVSRGLAVPVSPNSPVHEGPLDQTWGTREVYIDDPSGNTLIFQQR